MRALLASALLCAALGLTLAYAPARARHAGLGALLVGAVVGVLAPWPAAWAETLLALAWISVIVTAVLMHWPRVLSLASAVALGLNAGLWSGAALGLSGQLSALAIALPFALLAYPAAWLLGTPARLGVKIVASWLIAVAALAGAVAALVPTPGYVQDHRE